MNTKYLIMTLGTALSILASSALAQEVNYGTQIPTADELIETLSPDESRPQAKTRGINFNELPTNKIDTDQTSSKTAATTPAAAPSNAPQTKAASLQILFPFNSYVLTDTAINQLHPLGKALRSSRLAGLQFTVEGHTDATGPTAYNQVLSEQRASAIKQHLVDHYSVPDETLVTVGVGESKLLVPSQPAHASNRRVRIITQ